MLHSVTKCYKVLQKVTRKYILAANTEINLKYLYWAEPKKLFMGVFFNIQASNRVYGPVLILLFHHSLVRGEIVTVSVRGETH